MVSHACGISLSVGCCHDDEKPGEPNELRAALLRGPAILLMENSVAYSAELHPARSIYLKIRSEKREVRGTLACGSQRHARLRAAVWTNC